MKMSVLILAGFVLRSVETLCLKFPNAGYIQARIQNRPECIPAALEWRSLKISPHTQRYKNLYMSSLIGHVLKYSDTACVRSSRVS